MEDSILMIDLFGAGRADLPPQGFYDYIAALCGEDVLKSVGDVFGDRSVVLAITTGGHSLLQVFLKQKRITLDIQSKAFRVGLPEKIVEYVKVVFGTQDARVNIVKRPKEDVLAEACRIPRKEG